MVSTDYTDSILEFYSGGYADLTDEEIAVEEKYGISLEFPVSYESEPDFADLKDYYKWDIRYYFTGDVRGHIMPSGRSYGSAGMTFRRLFLILKQMNNGIDFIQDYINTQLPYSYAGEMLEDYLLHVMQVAESRWAEKHNMLRRTRRGTIDRRQRRKLRDINEFSASLEYEVADLGETVSDIIKEDIVAKLASGQLTLNPSGLSEATMKRREWAGLAREPRYYASSQFINNLHIICRLEKKEWLTDTDIMA